MVSTECMSSARPSIISTVQANNLKVRRHGQQQHQQQQQQRSCSRSRRCCRLFARFWVFVARKDSSPCKICVKLCALIDRFLTSDHKTRPLSSDECGNSPNIETLERRRLSMVCACVHGTTIVKQCLCQMIEANQP